MAAARLFTARYLPFVPLLLVPLLGLALGLGQRAPTTLFVVRHADRAGREDALSDLGRARAAALAHVLGGEPLAAIYHSDTQRTRDTAAPLAQALGLEPRVRPARDVAALAREIAASHAGQHVLVVGHANTVPELIRAAGGPALAELPESEFDSLFVLTLSRGWPQRAELLHLRYGAPSPVQPAG